ncbi:plasmid replication DNA-binding protein [Acinetobacter oleivorans]|uniref:plasmid replication DNA-binding protein n=1 Tax=Acinetobacter oleivorans TaxID=1148157 RepID=UPI00124FF91D|nr:plasmid replication DNA-binding protein [Acinetobacter oleivorans]
MAKLSLSEVSKRFNVSRSTLYRAIKEGRLSRNADGLFDIAEVIRCFGEPSKKHEQNQAINQPKDDSDLRQLVDFMRKEIESYKDREKRYLDQIDRFQLLLGHKETEEQMSQDTSVRQTGETPCNNSNKTTEDTVIKELYSDDLSHDTLLIHPNEAPKNISKTQYETKKKRGLFGRVLNAMFDND